jgi:hypothetical protein
MGAPYDAETAAMLLSWGGQSGVDVFSDTSSHEGRWSKIVSIGASALTSLTGNWSANPATLADGQAIYGRFTEIQLSSGKVHCYRVKEHL